MTHGKPIQTVPPATAAIPALSTVSLFSP